MDEGYRDSVERHWFGDAPGELIRRIDTGLVASGKDPQSLAIDDLLAVDEFHIRGREATAELADLAGFGREDRVIDVGSGLGGPSRYLAAHYGCDVTGIDLTAEYCAVASELAGRVGLGERVRYQQANALQLPFPDDHFTGAWTQHISMNIPDKAAMFAEMRRVVAPGGTLAIYDPIKGPGGDLQLPVPWAREPAMSHLVDAQATRALLEDVGLGVTTFNDVSEKSLAWFAANAAPRDGGPPPLGLHLLLGGDWPVMAGNMVANLRARAISVVQIIARV